MASGIALATRAVSPSCKMILVEPEGKMLGQCLKARAGNTYRDQPQGSLWGLRHLWGAPLVDPSTIGWKTLTNLPPSSIVTILIIFLCPKGQGASVAGSPAVPEDGGRGDQAAAVRPPHLPHPLRTCRTGGHSIRKSSR